MKVSRNVLLAALTFTSLLAACARDPMDDPEYAAACHGPPVHGAEARQKAMEEGYAINSRFDCIDKASWEEVQRAHELVGSLVKQAEEEVAQQQASVARLRASGLAAARHEFRTSLSAPSNGTPLPAPPERLFVRSDYESPGVGKLAAWVTPDPRNGQKHPAIVWITGGESNSLDDFWTEGGAEADQSASAFRKAGMIMMFPTLRGGNTNPGRREYFLGEVDDVIAAGAHLAKLPYVDRVYLGGHSTGGTLVLLVAESSDTFAAVFVFGAVSEATVYGRNFLPFDLASAPDQEQQLRSPVHWLEAIKTPTYLIEGEDAPGNFGELETMCAAIQNPAVKCVSVPGKNHFSVLDPVARKLASRIVIGEKDGQPLLSATDYSGDR